MCVCVCAVELNPCRAGGHAPQTLFVLMNNGSVGIDRLSISVYSLFNRQMKRALITSKQTAVFFPLAGCDVCASESEGEKEHALLALPHGSSLSSECLVCSVTPICNTVQSAVCQLFISSLILKQKMLSLH